ncbi:hypothetical protein [Conchiformibius kuhniae]|uniref:Uncharacterized protein n=1 Tax=Conchiformibius kuhniae TaxID=211502 RepID=A0A8T9MXX5_9NEIS|nr:hypothetical protein [Conchiformibius kuhniae]UOP05052.1 hypothetical protein LVJ77_01720 [Conchiformibius kuhniae]
MKQNHTLWTSLAVWALVGLLFAACFWGTETQIILCVAACALSAVGWLVWRVCTSRYRPLNAQERDDLLQASGHIAPQLILECCIWGGFGMVGLMIVFGGLGMAFILLPFAGLAYHYRHRIRQFLYRKD